MLYANLSKYQYRVPFSFRLNSSALNHDEKEQAHQEVLK